MSLADIGVHYVMYVYVSKPQFVPGLLAKPVYDQGPEAAVDEPVLQRTQTFLSSQHCKKFKSMSEIRTVIKKKHGWPQVDQMM